MPKAETNVEPYGTNQHLGLVCRSGTQPLLRLINRKRGSAPHVSFRFLVKTIRKASTRPVAQRCGGLLSVMSSAHPVMVPPRARGPVLVMFSIKSNLRKDSCSEFAVASSELRW